MIYWVAAASVLPLITYILVGLAKRSQATTIEEYFVYGQQISALDYANTSVGYALQMAAVFLFAYWGILYGIGAFWTPFFWFLGFFLLYKLLPRFLDYHDKSMTLHQYLAERYKGGKQLQAAASIATIVGLWGTMMAEVDYTVQLYSPIVQSQVYLFGIGALFLLFGVSYIVKNGYKAEVNTERIQVPLAYTGFITVLVLSLPAVWRHGGVRPYVTPGLCTQSAFRALVSLG